MAKTQHTREIYTITAQITREELSKLKIDIRDAIKNLKRIKPSDRNTLRQFPSIARQILEIYDSSENKDLLNDILEMIANHMIESHNGQTLEDLNDLESTSKIDMELLYSIHYRILLNGDKPIPKNLSASYLNELFTIAGKQPSPKYIYEEQIIRFAENLGREFRIENKAAYLEIIKGLIYDPIKFFREISNDPTINQNPRILHILINYARTYKDYCNEHGEEKTWEIAEIINIIQTNFRELINSLPESLWIALKEKIEDCFTEFSFLLLSKDITTYSSFKEFINEINTQLVDPVNPEANIPQKRIIINSRTDPDGMDDDTKFKAIQKLVESLRKESPNLVIPTILVGYKEPFEGYIVFPFEKERTFTVKDNSLPYDIAISDTFGTTKSGSFRTMTKSNIPKVLGSDRNSTGPHIAGTATRTASYSLPGVVAVSHISNFTYYYEMIQEAVGALLENPEICFGHSLRKKISEMSQNPRSRKTTASSTPPPQAKNPEIIIVRKAPKKLITPGADQYGYDSLGINLEEVKNTILYSSQNAISKARENISNSLFKKYKYNQNNPSRNLLDHFLTEMLISGKNIVDVVNDLLAREEYKELVEHFNQNDTSPQKDTAFRAMYAYVKNMISIAVENDPEYPNEKMKELYETELKNLEDQSVSLDKILQVQKAKRSQLVQNTKRALEYFNTTYKTETETEK